MKDPRRRWARALAGLVVAVVVVVSAGAVALRFAEAPEAPCRGRGTAVVVDTRSHRLFLCRDGRAEGEFRVALGRGGLAKQREHDARTPLGTYALGAPRASVPFHRFVPVGYPTPEQRESGRTGGAIGVHGPPSAFRLLGPVTTWVDWTEGCIAVASRPEIQTIAAWVEAEEPLGIVIE